MAGYCWTFVFNGSQGSGSSSNEAQEFVRILGWDLIRECGLPRRMRDLSGAEARVIRELLVDRPGSERLRRNAAHVPRSTYQSIRKRAVELGWIDSRYVPSPSVVGAHHLRVELVQPFAERRADVLRDLLALDGLVVLWECPGSILAVTFDRTSTQNPLPPSPDPRCFRKWVVVPTMSVDHVRAYFDFEGIWSRWAVREDPVAYPRGLGPPTGPPEPGNPSNGNHGHARVAELVSSPFRTTREGPSGFLRSVGGERRRLRHAIERGEVFPRTFPRLDRLPGVGGLRLDSTVFVSGLRMDASSNGNLFEELVSQARVTPFLYADDNRRVFVAFLSPAPPWVVDGRTPVTGVLRGHLRDIEIVREPIAAINPVVNHRYDRLFEPGVTLKKVVH
jgi:hypothetical protein